MIRFIVLFIVSSLVFHLGVSGLVSFINWEFELLNISSIGSNNRFMYLIFYMAWQGVSIMLYIDSGFRSHSISASYDDKDSCCTHTYIAEDSNPWPND